MRGRIEMLGLVEAPPHPTAIAPQVLRSAVDLSPHAGRGERMAPARQVNKPRKRIEAAE
jgi:hypothetical protein